VIDLPKSNSQQQSMFSRLCFWRPNSSREFVILPTATEDIDGLTLLDEGYETMHQWEREKLNEVRVRYMHRKDSDSVCSSSLNLSSAMVQATWNQVECTQSTDSDTLGSLGIVTLPSYKLWASESESRQSPELIVSMDQNYAQLMLYNRDEESKFDISRGSYKDDNEYDTDSRFMDEQANTDVETSDGYKADDDEYSSENDDMEDNARPFDVHYQHPALFQDDAESLAWRSDATEMTKMLQNYNTMCCAGNESGDDSSSTDSSVWSNLR
jgi:hypothetical protein